MGSFDKQAPASGKDKQAKQMVMVVGLGLALAVVVWFQFMKPSPRPASAGEPGNAVEFTAAPAESIAAAMADLVKDPTETLLVARNTPQYPELSKAPRNPFQMSSKWMSTLVRPETAATNSQPENPVVERPMHSNGALILSVNTESLKLQGIFRESASTYTAILNGSIVKAGSVLGKTRVIKVLEDRLILQHVDSPEGPKAELVLKKLK